MGRSIPGLEATKATIIAVESLAADALLHAPPEVILVRPFGSLDDWSLAVLAEILFSIADQMGSGKGILKGQRRRVLDRAWAALEQALDSPTASPLLWYEEAFYDVAQEYRLRGKRRAIELMKRGLAHNLRHNQGSNADSFLRDLAETYLWVGELDQGLAILTLLLRNDPADIWTYNLAAITFDHFGLAKLGVKVARRGLEVLAVTGDPDDLHAQLLRSLDDLQRSEKSGREADVTQSVLADFHAALALDSDTGLHRPITQLCHELITDLDQVPVKELAQAPDLPPRTEQKRSPQARKQHLQGKSRRRTRRRRKGKKRR
jgi:tetratricopeptide (TPR) repeat protein